MYLFTQVQVYLLKYETTSQFEAAFLTLDVKKSKKKING